jgi:hypothetical protein
VKEISRCSFYERTKTVQEVLHNVAQDDGVVLYIPFEHLTADRSGPETLQKLAHLLQSVNVTVPDDDAIECLWKHLVKDAP